MQDDMNRSHSGNDRKITVVVNGIHAKSGGGVTYLRNIIPLLAQNPKIKIHLFLHKEQLDIFYPYNNDIALTVFSYKSKFLQTFIWEQISLPVIVWAMGADVVYSPANYGPVFARNHVILLRNAVSVIRLINRIWPAVYWMVLSVATLVSFTTATKAIAVSKYAARILTFKLPLRMMKKVHTIYHGVDSTFSGRTNYQTPRTYLLAVSDIYVQKNYHTLIQAFLLVKKDFPELTLKIAGREIDKTYALKIRALIAENGLEKDVQLLGHIDRNELVNLYLDAHIFVFPSLVETFGNPLLEAMAFGSPIACSNTAAMPEVIGDTGVQFDPHNAEDIAEKIILLHTSSALRETLGRKAYERSKQFSWKRCAEQTAAVLCAAAGSRQSGTQRIR